MGNICECCLKAEPDGNEAPPVETTELLPARNRPTERTAKSYDAILETASNVFNRLRCANSTFLVANKPKGRGHGNSSDTFSDKSIESIRSKLADAVVPPNLAVSPPANPNAKELWYGRLSSQNMQPNAGADTQVAGRVVEDKVAALESSIKSSVVRFKNSEADWVQPLVALAWAGSDDIDEVRPAIVPASESKEISSDLELFCLET
eukprot:gene29574-35699_t